VDSTSISTTPRSIILILDQVIICLVIAKGSSLLDEERYDKDFAAYDKRVRDERSALRRQLID